MVNVLRFVGQSYTVILLYLRCWWTSICFHTISHNLQCNPNSLHIMILLQHLLFSWMYVCACVRVFVGLIRSHPNFRKVINLPNCICLDILKEVGFSKLHYIFYILDKTHTLFTKGIGQAKLIYYLHSDCFISPLHLDIETRETFKATQNDTILNWLLSTQLLNGVYFLHKITLHCWY